jgi:serine/threonine protein kinase
MKRPLQIKTLLQMSIRGKIIGEKMGASGVVYIVDNGANCYPQKVAFKTFQEKFCLDEIKKKHFLDECIKWFENSNGYTATPFYANVINGQPFICMPYYESDLKYEILSRKFNEAEALVVLTELSKGLLELYKSGVHQHQDFNPPNILLKDLRTSFRDYPSINMINYEVIVADFGMVNIYRILGADSGKIGGKFAFKAPEQYSKGEQPKEYKEARYSEFTPDIFAFGVIMYMLFTGKHPNGLNVSEALNKNTRGSIFKRWAFSNPKVTLTNKRLESLINACLSENPSLRPSVEVIYNFCTEELRLIDKNALENLILRFNQKDKQSTYLTKIKRLETQKKISELPQQRESILANLILEFEGIDVNHLMGAGIVYYFEIVKYILIIVRKEDNLEVFLIKTLFKVLHVLIRKHMYLKVEHKYPSLNDQGDFVVQTPPIRDIEIPSGYLAMIIQALEKFGEADKADRIIRRSKDKVFESIYSYYLASTQKDTNIFKALQYLDRAKNQNENEPLFDEMKMLWIKMALVRAEFEG